MDERNDRYTSDQQNQAGEPRPEVTPQAQQPQQPTVPPQYSQQPGQNPYLGQQPPAPPPGQPYYPPQYQAPMYGRSAGGQYGGAPQPPQYYYNAQPAGQYAQNPALYDDKRPGSPFFNKETFAEKQTVRRLGNAVGLSLSMFAIISTVLQLVILAVMYLTMGVSESSRLLSNPNMVYLMNAVMTLVALTVPYIVAARSVGVNVREILPFQKVSFTKTVTLVMLGMGVCALSNYASGALSTLLDQLFGVTVETSMSDYGTGMESFLLMLLCVGILPAILEEFAFRGVVLGLLRKRFSDGASIFISAALFGLLHGNLQQIPFAFGVGLVMGYATVYTNSLFPAMFIHALNNSLSVVLSFATESVSPMVGSVISLLYYAVSLLMGICGFIMLTKTDRTAMRLGHERCDNTKRDLKWFCGSAWIVAFIVICALEVVAVQGLAMVS